MFLASSLPDHFTVRARFEDVRRVNPCLPENSEQTAVDRMASHISERNRVAAIGIQLHLPVPLTQESGFDHAGRPEIGLGRAWDEGRTNPGSTPRGPSHHRQVREPGLPPSARRVPAQGDRANSGRTRVPPVPGVGGLHTSFAALPLRLEPSAPLDWILPPVMSLLHGLILCSREGPPVDRCFGPRPNRSSSGTRLRALARVFGEQSPQ